MFGEHHEKCNLDAFTAVLKNGWRQYVLRCKAEGIGQGQLLLVDAQSCLEWSRKELFRACIKVEGMQHIPNKPRKGCKHAVETVNWDLLLPRELELERDRQCDVSTVDGTLSHYQYRFLSEGKLEMRWLSCPCDNCFQKQFDDCFNAHWVGRFQAVTMKKLDARGVAASATLRNRLTSEIADSLTKDDVVAVRTKVDTRGYQYWLARVSNAAQTLTKDTVCEVSGEEFKAGERVVYLFYFDRFGQSDRLFRYAEELGMYMAPVSMLRYGGSNKPIELTVQSTRSTRSQASKVYELSEDLAQKITNTMIYDFNDNDN